EGDYSLSKGVNFICRKGVNCILRSTEKNTPIQGKYSTESIGRAEIFKEYESGLKYIETLQVTPGTADRRGKFGSSK
ncbi:MAG: hypothetical protein COZ94_07340, partial [Nitrospirae bacterium CG_4_8_14_3_um_filter_41_47]